MKKYSSHFLKKAPFLRLFIAQSLGILLQWYLPLSPGFWWIIVMTASLILLLFFFIPLFSRWRLFMIAGMAVTLIFISLGALLAYYHNVKNSKGWFGYTYSQKDAVIAVLDEPLSEKARSYKANAWILKITRHDSELKVEGKMILYFKKDQPAGKADSGQPDLHYGSVIVFKKDLQPIKNAGNPGGFDYERYALFQGITHQVFLKPGEFGTLHFRKKNWFRNFIYTAQRSVLNSLREHLHSEKERGLAEALLIGYKDDLDQNLVQSYTNTGVVHIIAISGMHISLVYWLLMLFFRPLHRKKNLRWLIGLFVIAGIWLFSIMAGGGPSILRSALMFSCIVIGKELNRKTNIYNSLSLSAFILLCINPFCLWDVGFQLSYAAVLSIVIFFKPVYNWFYFKNKAIDFIWKMNAVSMAAQVLTVPLSIYHFHQFPVWFLLTNFIAIPLSSIIILGEILLVAIGWWPAAGALCGKILTWMMGFMDSWIENIEHLRYSLWDGLQVNAVQTLLLYLFIAAISFWLLESSRRSLLPAISFLFLFSGFRVYSFWEKSNQQKIIVYNVPRYRAIDFIEGRNYIFAGDTDLISDSFLRNFHLRPSRIRDRISPSVSLKDFNATDHVINYAGKNILLLNSSFRFHPFPVQPLVDLLIISGKPKINIPQLAGKLVIRKIIFDSSVPFWKTPKWKHDCDSLHIPCYDVNEKGAFVMNIR